MGYFITFEGGEGAGKSTQIQLLHDYLCGNGYMVVCTREPGGTPFAESIRALLVTDNGYYLSAACELALFIASRLHHVQTVIKPALQQGKVVLCDRYVDSTLVYQGIAGNLGFDTIWRAHEVLMGADFLIPDATICLDIDPKQGLNRSQGGDKNEDRFEKKTVDFHNKVRQGFLHIAATSDRYTVIDADDAVENIFKAIVCVWEQTNT